MKYKYLLAKSCRDPDNPPSSGTTLAAHTFQVVQAAEVILSEVYDFKKVTLSKEKGMLLKKLVLAASVLHDLGKANNVFQGMLARDKQMMRKIHPVRHEILTAILIAKLESSLKDWLKKLFDDENEKLIWMVSWIAGGHHLKLHRDRPFSNKENERLVRVQGIPGEFIFLGGHPDIKQIFQECSYWTIWMKKSELPLLRNINIPIDEENEDDFSIEEIVEEYIEESEKQASNLSIEDKKCLALAKAILIAADVAGSALSKGNENTKDWIKRALAQKLSVKNLEKIVNDSLKGGNSLYSFQKKIRDSRSPVTLTIAGCGNGKTLAAYAWAMNHAEKRKLFFCYPTTGTASSGFEDYLLSQSTLERTLIHGRSHVDIERMLGANEKNHWEENQRLESLKAWTQQVIACTTDAVLGLIQNQRRGLFSFPSMINAAFVFDEIHNYDLKLFGALIRFLKSFPEAPVLLMSASIPPVRLRILQDSLGKRLSEPIMGDPEFEELERYTLKWHKHEKECWKKVVLALNAEAKILWVCNTVDDAIAISKEAHRRNIYPTPLLYHSRYRYKDRVEIQDNVIGRFRGKGAVFVIATQVCEMSLDISADLLISALAPFPALMQRLGRLNRTANNNSSPNDCLIYEFICSENRPYLKKELEISKNILSTLWDKPCSQRDLAQGLEKIHHDEELKDHSAWLDGVWETDQRPLRDTNPSLTVILREDIRDIKSYIRNKNLKPTSCSVAAWTIPMWYNPCVKIANYFAGYPVIENDFVEYDPKTGARWKKWQAWETI